MMRTILPMALVIALAAPVARATEPPGEQAVDRLGVDTGRIQLMLIETSTRYLIDTVSIRSRGGLLTFHDNQPQDLIAAPLEDYARSLLGMSR